jgi:hypothetical protein
MAGMVDDRTNFDSAGQAAIAWMTAVTNGEKEVAWCLCDGNLRLAFAQAWVLHYYGLPDERMAAALAQPIDDGWPEWRGCMDLNTSRWIRAYGSWTQDGWGLWTEDDSYSDPVSPDLERVTLVHGTTPGHIEANTPLLAQHFIFRRRQDWRLAGIGSVIAVPGWPPTQNPIPR